MQITFKFKPETFVITPFGERGIVETLGYQDGQIKYYVQTKDGGAWFNEDKLKEA